MSLADLPPELIQEILEYGLHNDADALLGLVSTCRYLCHTLWPLYAAARWERFRYALINPNLIKLSVDDEEDDDDDDEEDDGDDDDEYESDSSEDRKLYYNPATEMHHRAHGTKTGQGLQTPAYTYHPTEDPFTISYTRAVIHLANAYSQTDRQLLCSFLKRVRSIASLVIDFGSGADIHFAAALIRAGAQIPFVDLSIRGSCLTGHSDWQSGPYNPIPAVPTGEVKNKEDYIDALRRPRSVDLFPVPSSQISGLTISADAMFIASVYPLTLSLLAPSPHLALTTLTLHALSLDFFNWSQILPSIALPSLSDLALTRLELSAADLVPFLARHEGTLTALDLTHTLAPAMTLRLLSVLSLPLLSSLRADPACLVPLLQHLHIHNTTHTGGGLGALHTLGITFPARLALALRAMPKPHSIPPELDDLAVRDLSEFHAVYALLARFCQSSGPNTGQGQGLTTLEMENLRYNGFVEWVLSSSSSLSFSSVQELVITDGDLIIRRGTVLPLAQWMGKHCPSWHAQLGKVSRFSQPTDTVVQEMVRVFFTVVFPGMVSLQYKMVP